MEVSQLLRGHLPSLSNYIAFFVAIIAFSYIAANVIGSFRIRRNNDRGENEPPACRDTDGIADDEVLGRRSVSIPACGSVAATAVGLAAAVMNVSCLVRTSSNSKQESIEFGIGIATWVGGACTFRV